MLICIVASITYTAEKVSDKDDEHPAWGIVPRVQALESVRLAIMVEHGVSLYLA